MVAEEDSADLRAPERQAMLREITQLVNTALREAYPTCPQLSSEDVLSLIDLGDSDGGATGSHWVLDPIDGTRGFENLRQYALCLGMLQDGVAVLGVLGCPNVPLGRAAVQADAEPCSRAGTARDGVGAVYAAVRGCGAYAGLLASTGALTTCGPSASALQSTVTT
jgi:3'-phosphoadenosine 5'-phosphosulfate (PAPS) 3'-phosphatase